MLILLLLLAVALYVTFGTIRDICWACLLTSSGQVVEGETIRAWSRVKRHGRQYHVEYRFRVDGLVYEGEHSVPREVMEQAKEEGVVPVHYLARNPAVNGPQFWGQSLVGYLLSKSWAVFVLVGFCVMLIMAFVSD